MKILQKEQKLYEYQNGNYTTEIFSDGTKVRTTDEDQLRSDFPDNMDVKITDFCDMGHICKYCHEGSNIRGRHAEIPPLLDALSILPGGVEIAIGGGDPLSHPELVSFLVGAKEIGLISNMTVNEMHLSEFSMKFLKSLQDSKLIYGIGLSYRRGFSHGNIVAMSKNKDAVIHIIAGVDDFKEIFEFAVRFPKRKFLILGYKTFRKGVSFKKGQETLIDGRINEWKNNLKSFVDLVTSTRGVVSFDNLALEQLDVRSLLSDEEWEMFYQGEDGIGGNLYIDAVKKQFSFSSRCAQRFDFMTIDREILNVKEMFHTLRSHEKSYT